MCVSVFAPFENFAPLILNYHALFIIPNLVCECIQLQWLSVCECVSDQSLLLTLSPLPALSCEERLLGGGESGGAGRSGSSRPQAKGADEETATLSSAT